MKFQTPTPISPLPVTLCPSNETLSGKTNTSCTEKLMIKSSQLSTESSSQQVKTLISIFSFWQSSNYDWAYVTNHKQGFPGLRFVKTGTPIFEDRDSHVLKTMILKDSQIRSTIYGSYCYFNIHVCFSKIPEVLDYLLNQKGCCDIVTMMYPNFDQ